MSTKYQSSESCTRECQYGQDRKKGIIPIKLESGFNATGALGLITAGKLYIDFSDSSKFNDNMKSLKQEIETKTGKVQKEGTVIIGINCTKGYCKWLLLLFGLTLPSPT